MKEYTVELFWDMEANVWVATSDDVRGLVLESEESMEVLKERVRLVVPELLELNDCSRNEPYSLRFVLSAL